jgi:hypothetical protein
MFFSENHSDHRSDSWGVKIPIIRAIICYKYNILKQHTLFVMDKQERDQSDGITQQLIVLNETKRKIDAEIKDLSEKKRTRLLTNLEYVYLERDIHGQTIALYSNVENAFRYKVWRSQIIVCKASELPTEQLDQLDKLSYCFCYKSLKDCQCRRFGC